MATCSPASIEHSSQDSNRGRDEAEECYGNSWNILIQTDWKWHCKPQDVDEEVKELVLGVHADGGVVECVREMSQHKLCVYSPHALQYDIWKGGYTYMCGG